MVESFDFRVDASACVYTMYLTRVYPYRHSYIGAFRVIWGHMGI